MAYADDSFDLVTGFRSLFFADDIIAALREARPVAHPDAQVVIQVFGRPEHCDLEAVKDAAARIGAAARRPPAVALASDRRGTRTAGRPHRRALVLDHLHQHLRR
jgi:hypothetical protein